MNIDNNLKSIKSENDLALYRTFLEKDSNGFTIPQHKNSKTDFKSLNELINSLLGKYVKAQFISGNNSVWRQGIIKSVGDDYFIIKNPTTSSDTVCRTGNLLFLNEMPSKFRSNQTRG